MFAYRRKLGSTKFFPAPVYLKAGQKLFKWTITMLVPSLGIPRARRRVVSTDSRRAAHEPLTWLKLLHSGSACAHMSPKYSHYDGDSSLCSLKYNKNTLCTNNSRFLKAQSLTIYAPPRKFRAVEWKRRSWHARQLLIARGMYNVIMSLWQGHSSVRVITFLKAVPLQASPKQAAYERAGKKVK